MTEQRPPKFALLWEAVRSFGLKVDDPGLRERYKLADALLEFANDHTAKAERASLKNRKEKEDEHLDWRDRALEIRKNLFSCGSRTFGEVLGGEPTLQVVNHEGKIRLEGRLLCESSLCPSCSVRKARKNVAKIMEWRKENTEKLLHSHFLFVTLTLPSKTGKDKISTREKLELIKRQKIRLLRTWKRSGKQFRDRTKNARGVMWDLEATISKKHSGAHPHYHLLFVGCAEEIAQLQKVVARMRKRLFKERNWELSKTVEEKTAIHFYPGEGEPEDMEQMDALLNYPLKGLREVAGGGAKDETWSNWNVSFFKADSPRTIRYFIEAFEALKGEIFFARRGDFAEANQETLCNKPFPFDPDQVDDEVETPEVGKPIERKVLLDLRGEVVERLSQTGNISTFLRRASKVRSRETGIHEPGDFETAPTVRTWEEQEQ